MRYFLLFNIIFIFSGIYSQIVVTDINNKPIPYVEVLSSNKHFYTQTNLKGEIAKHELEKLNPNDTLFFKLITYEKKSFLKSDLKSSDTVVLQERIKEGVQEIQEFSVVSNSKKYKYQKIDACYRSYQVNDDSVSYYLDGTITYLSKINSSKFNISLKENRSYANKVIEEVDDNPDRRINFTFSPSIPRPPFYYLPFQYDKSLTYRVKDSSVIELFINDTIYVGNIEKDQEYIKYSIADYDFVGTNTLLKNEINRISNQITLVFRNYEGLDVTSIKNFDDLLYYKSYREYSIKHDKDSSYKRFLQVDELFFEDVSYLEIVNKKEYNSSRGMAKTSHYVTEFWKDCNCELYEEPLSQLLGNLYER